MHILWNGKRRGHYFNRQFVLCFTHVSSNDGRYSVVVWCMVTVKGKAIPSQASTGPEGSRRMGLPEFKTIGT